MHIKYLLLTTQLFFRVCVYFCFLPINNVWATQSSDEALVEDEIIALGTIYQVIAPNKDLANKAAISFHANLLESDLNAGIHIMSLNVTEKQDLEQFGFKVIKHTQWAEKYRQNRMGYLESKRSRNGINNTAQTQSAVQQGIDNYSCYPTVEETYQQASALAAANPTLATWIDIGDSWEKVNTNGGYDLMVLKISNSAISADKPKLFIHSAMHAREYTTAALTLEFAKTLLNQYQSNADVRWIVDWHEVHILFHMNPDGRKKAEQGISWRKNTNQNYCGPSSNNRGVDLNRNFAHFWNVTNGQGSSSNPCSFTYRGAALDPGNPALGPDLEPETKSVQDYVRSLFVDNRGPFDTDPAPAYTSGIHLDIHSYSELVLWPYGHTNSTAPNALALQTLGRKFAFFNGYTPEQSIGLYPTDGTSDSVSYGELGVPAFTFELGTAFFQNCSTYENTIKPDNLPALLYAAKAVRAPYQLPAGPEVISPSVSPATPGGVAAGTLVTLRVTATDQRFNNSNGTEPTQSVVTAEYFIDSPPWSNSPPAANPMSVVDGNANSSVEEFEAIIDTTGFIEGQHTLYIQATDQAGNTGVVSAVFLDIHNNAQPQLSVSDIVVDEGRYAQFMIRLSQPTSTDVRFNILTADDTATSGNDYGARSGLRVISAGEIEKIIWVPTTDDNEVEGDERFELRLSAVIGASVTDGIAIATIVDDDSSVGLPELSVSDTVADEGRYAQFRVHLSQPALTAVQFNMQTANGTATSGSDYGARSGLRVIAAGEVEKIIWVPTIDDAQTEGDENLSLQLSDAVGAVITDGEGVATIVDNDGSVGLPQLSVSDAVVDEGRYARFIIRLSQASTQDVQFNIQTVNGSAMSGSDYGAKDGLRVIVAGEIEKIIWVPTTNDTQPESNESFSLQLSEGVGVEIIDGNAVGTIVDND